MLILKFFLYKESNNCYKHKSLYHKIQLHGKLQILTVQNLSVPSLGGVMMVVPTVWSLQNSRRKHYKILENCGYPLGTLTFRSPPRRQSSVILILSNVDSSAYYTEVPIRSTGTDKYILSHFWLWSILRRPAYRPSNTPPSQSGRNHSSGIEPFGTGRRKLLWSFY